MRLALILSLAISGLTFAAPTQYRVKVIQTYPHNSSSFTEGLVYYGGYLYEGTGLNGKSELQKINLSSGISLKTAALPERYFGEGITILGGKIYQLTWKSRTGFIYSVSTFKQIGSFEYPTEGWGMTHNGKQLIMSDGTDRIFFLDPKTLKKVKTLQVKLGKAFVFNINELEYIHGKIYANIWQTPWIYIINPTTGQVEGVIDVSPLAMMMPKSADVPNGIAFDAKNKRLFITGKLWPNLFEIELVPAT